VASAVVRAEFGAHAVVAGHSDVGLADLAEALLPIVKLADAYADPGKQVDYGNLRLVRP
jgi:hypothetical protein